jgi:diketogulonate reductase-like aldo/keto reductase
VEAALSVGYRHIDTAAAYFNEKEVGEGLANSDVDRTEIFVGTKIWITDYGYDETLHSFDKSAGKLGLDQIDLLLLHQPLSSKFEQTLASYRALEKLLTDGKVRAIGVSNFTVEHLTRLLDSVEVVPAANQIQLHPYFQQRDVQAFDAEHGILTQAWSPIGGITFCSEGSDQRSTLDEETIGPHRCRSLEEPGPGHAALAPAGGPLGHPQVDQGPPHRRELRRLRLRAQR